MTNVFKRSLRKIHDWAVSLPVLGLLVVLLEQGAYDFISWNYLRQFFFDHLQDDALADPGVLDLVSVAFNNESVIDAQIKLIKKYLTGPYRLTVADNSPDPKKRILIKAVCDGAGVGYISMPANPFSGRFGNWSHGLALNWVFKHYIFPRGANYFGFLDHDLFPVRSTAVIPILKKYSLAGAVHRRGDIWYLWPGCCFFRTELFRNKKFNFSSRVFLRGVSLTATDTGGGNWPFIYSRLSERDCCAFSHTLAFFNEQYPRGPMFEQLGALADAEKKYDTSKLGSSDKLVEFLGDWLHIRRMGYGGSKELNAKLNVIVSHYLQDLS